VTRHQEPEKLPVSPMVCVEMIPATWAAVNRV